MRFTKLTLFTTASLFTLAAAAPTALAGSQQSGDLAITITASPDPVAPGGTVTFTVSLSNVGGSDVNNAEVELTLPAGVDNITVGTVAPYSCGAPSGSFVGCSISTHPADVTATLTFTARALPSAADGSVLTANGTISSISINDINTANNTASDSVTVVVPTTTTAAPTTTTTLAPTTTAVGGGAGSATTVAPAIPDTGADNTDTWLLAALLLLVAGAATMWMVRRPSSSAPH